MNDKFVANMSDNNNRTELTTSQINQSEAGPDIVQPDHNLEYVKIRNNENNVEKPVKQPVNVVAPLKVEGRSGTQVVLEQELAKLEGLVLDHDKMTQKRLADNEEELAAGYSQFCALREKVRDSDEREKMLKRKIGELEKSEKEVKIVMQEYELLIGKLTAEVEANKALRVKVDDLTVEKEGALQHLSNVEAAFSDVHSKYEKCKKVVEELRKNESTLRNSISELQETVRAKQITLENVQTHAGNQLENAQRNLERMSQQHEQELTRLTAMLRKTELKVISLQESLDQKVKENNELTTICDDLIAGKGYNRQD